MDTWDMPDWRRDDGTMMIWDPTSHTYVEGPTDGGDLAVDRGHASGGDNDLFDPAGGNEGHGDGNLFQPSNPDGNGWLEGKTSASDPEGTNWFYDIERGDEIIVSTTHVGDGDSTDVLIMQDRVHGQGEIIVARNSAGEEFYIEPSGEVWMNEEVEPFPYGWVMQDAFTMKDGLTDDEPGDLTLPEHWGKLAMAMRPEQWAEIVQQNPYMYHVTEPNRLPSIREHGLVPGSSVSDKTEGVWTEMGGIPARQGFIYLWATKEGAEHGADWFLGIPNPAILTIDATQLDPKLIEADEDYPAADPRAFVEQHGGPTPDDFYGNTDEHDNGNWSGWDPWDIAAEVGSDWSVKHPNLGDPDVTYESYKGFGDRQDYHGRVAYGGPIPPEAIETGDHNGRIASVESPGVGEHFMMLHMGDYAGGLEGYGQPPIDEYWVPIVITRVDDRGITFKDDQGMPEVKLFWEWDEDVQRGAIRPSEHQAKTAAGYVMYARVAMPYHVSPRRNREKIEQEGLHTLDVNHAGTPQDGDGLYYWDKPEQAKFFGDTEYAPKPYDMWQFDLDHQFEQPETDEFFGDMTPEEANQYYGDGMDLFYNEDGTPGAHYIPGGHISPDRIKRVSMAEQTGDPELDSLIAEFSQKYDKMRDPMNAEMSCQWMSWEFVNFLRERGIPASTGMSMDTNRTEPEPGDWHDDEFASLPEIGYDDAPIDNGMTHCVVYVPRDEATYMVDWTASQYGYNEFPMVQRMQGDPASGISFERNF